MTPPAVHQKALVILSRWAFRSVSRTEKSKAALEAMSATQEDVQS